MMRSSPGRSCRVRRELSAIVYRRGPMYRRSVGDRSNGCRFHRSIRPTRCIGRGNGIRVPSSSPRAQMLGAPLGPGPAHVVQFRPVGVEQGVREGAKQQRSPAIDLCFIHVSVLLRSDPLSRSYKLGFCLSAPNICALKPGPLATGSLGDAAAGASAAGERR